MDPQLSPAVNTGMAHLGSLTETWKSGGSVDFCAMIWRDGKAIETRI